MNDPKTPAPAPDFNPVTTLYLWTTALGFATKALIATHPDAKAFTDAFNALVAQFQSTAEFLGATEEDRAYLRRVCSALIEELPPSTSADRAR